MIIVMLNCHRDKVNLLISLVWLSRIPAKTGKTPSGLGEDTGELLALLPAKTEKVNLAITISVYNRNA
jgi:hypothetical protein